MTGTSIEDHIEATVNNFLKQEGKRTIDEELQTFSSQFEKKLQSWADEHDKKTEQLLRDSMDKHRQTTKKYVDDQLKTITQQKLPTQSVPGN